VTGTVGLITVIGFFLWIIVGWLMLLFVWKIVDYIAMVVHDVPWAGWMLFIVAVLFWPIAPIAVMPFAWLADKILNMK
jgi:hypothetical protein